MTHAEQERDRKMTPEEKEAKKRVALWNSQLATTKHQLDNLSAERDRLQKEVSELKAQKAEAVLEVNSELNRKQASFADEILKIQTEHDALDAKRAKIHKEAESLAKLQEMVEMKRRDLKNDIDRVDQFMGIVNQAVSVWTGKR